MTETKATYTTKDQTIFRVKKSKDNPFVMMDKRPIENENLSWKAKGLLSYLLSRPDDWTVRISDLVKRSTDGEHATRKAIKELIVAGHLSKHQKQEGGRFLSVVYDVYENPSENPEYKKPLRDKPQAEKPQAENHALSNKYLSKKDLNNISEEKESSEISLSENQKANNQKTHQEANRLMADLRARDKAVVKKSFTAEKTIEIAGIEAAIFAGRDVTEKDVATDRGETLADRLIGWRNVRSVKETHISLLRQFCESFGATPPRAKNEKNQSSTFYAWLAGLDALIENAEGKDAVKIVRELGGEIEVDDREKFYRTPNSLRNKVLDKAHAPEIKREKFITDKNGMVIGIASD